MLHPTLGRESTFTPHLKIVQFYMRKYISWYEMYKQYN